MLNMGNITILDPNLKPTIQRSQLNEITKTASFNNYLPKIPKDKTNAFSETLDTLIDSLDFNSTKTVHNLEIKELANDTIFNSYVRPIGYHENRPSFSCLPAKIPLLKLFSSRPTSNQLLSRNGSKKSFSQSEPKENTVYTLSNISTDELNKDTISSNYITHLDLIKKSIEITKNIPSEVWSGNKINSTIFSQPASHENSLVLNCDFRPSLKRLKVFSSNDESSFLNIEKATNACSNSLVETDKDDSRSMVINRESDVNDKTGKINAIFSKKLISPSQKISSFDSFPLISKKFESTSSLLDTNCGLPETPRKTSCDADNLKNQNKKTKNVLSFELNAENQLKTLSVSKSLMAVEPKSISPTGKVLCTLFSQKTVSAYPKITKISNDKLTAFRPDKSFSQVSTSFSCKQSKSFVDLNNTSMKVNVGSPPSSSKNYKLQPFLPPKLQLIDEVSQLSTPRNSKTLDKNSGLSNSQLSTKLEDKQFPKHAYVNKTDEMFKPQSADSVLFDKNVNSTKTKVFTTNFSALSSNFSNVSSTGMNFLADKSCKRGPHLDLTDVELESNIVEKAVICQKSFVQKFRASLASKPTLSSNNSSNTAQDKKLNDFQLMEQKANSVNRKRKREN